MTLDELKTLLANGAITQEAFDMLSKSLQNTDPAQEPTNDPTNEPTNDPAQEPTNDQIDLEKLDKIVQARVDKQMAAERKKNVDLKNQLERLQKAKLTDDELKQIEFEEKERALAEREKALTERMNREYAQKALREAGLDDGSETAFALVDFVMGADETEINEKVKTFKELFDKSVEVAVMKRFKENGRTPKQGTTIGNVANPYKAETFNLTKQIEIAQSNPELAARMRAEAGIQ